MRRLLPATAFFTANSRWLNLHTKLPSTDFTINTLRKLPGTSGCAILYAYGITLRIAEKERNIFDILSLFICCQRYFMSTFVASQVRLFHCRVALQHRQHKIVQIPVQDRI